MAEGNNHCLMRLFFLVFILSVAVPASPYSFVPGYGLFGELKSLVVINEDKEEISEVSSKITVRRKQKGKNIFNRWLFVSAYIVCLRLLACSIPLPETDTIVAKKVRMNN